MVTFSLFSILTMIGYTASRHPNRDPAIPLTAYVPAHVMRNYEEFGMNPRISMITVGVRDFAVSVKFYEEGLGFPRMESPPDVAIFTLNGT